MSTTLPCRRLSCLFALCLAVAAAPQVAAQTAGREARNGTSIEFSAEASRSVNNDLFRAVVSAEDDRFMQHSGFDWAGIQKALEKNQQRGRIVAGGSTITQQLAKNLFLSPNKTLLRKAQEAVLTVMIELTWDKQRILEVYLNVIEWGNGIFGAEAAARHYYGVGAARLNPAQAARLAAMKAMLAGKS